MEPLISVIIPIYRTEPYLRKCVDSILHQTYWNLEIILVDEIPDMCVNEAPKTKSVVAYLEAIGAGQNVLLLDADVECCLELAAHNLSSVMVMSAASVNPYILMYFRKVVITKAGLEVLGKRLG